MSKRKNIAVIENIAVNQNIFSFSGARIWALITVYQYENPSGYITEKYL